jgi:hypothetical protein
VDIQSIKRQATKQELTMLKAVARMARVRGRFVPHFLSE